MGVIMPINQKIIKQLSGDTLDSSDTLLIEDPNFTHEDLIELQKIFPENSPINNIRIGENNLTPNSYHLLLSLIKSHKNIVSFSIRTTKPSMNAAVCNGAIRKILAERQSSLQKEIPLLNKNPSSVDFATQKFEKVSPGNKIAPC